VQHLFVTWGRLKSFFFSLSASIPSVIPLGLISTFAPIGMLDLGWTLALTPSVKRALLNYPDAHIVGLHSRTAVLIWCTTVDTWDLCCVVWISHFVNNCQFQFFNISSELEDCWFQLFQKTSNNQQFYKTVIFQHVWEPWLCTKIISLLLLTSQLRTLRTTLITARGLSMSLITTWHWLRLTMRMWEKQVNKVDPWDQFQTQSSEPVQFSSQVL
jgi:hypothetical protein